jgi:hypothetical protein
MALKAEAQMLINIILDLLIIQYWQFCWVLWKNNTVLKYIFTYVEISLLEKYCLWYKELFFWPILTDWSVVRLLHLFIWGKGPRTGWGLSRHSRLN